MSKKPRVPNSPKLFRSEGNGRTYLKWWKRKTNNPDYCTQQGSHSNIKGKENEVAQSCPTLCDPMDCCPPGSSVHGIFQAIVLEWIVISFSSGSSQPKDWTQVSGIVYRRFTIWATREVLWRRNQKLYSQAKAERIQHHQKSSLINAKGSSLDRKHRKGL